MIYLGTFGLEDPIREGVPEAIKLIRYGTNDQEKIDKIKQSSNKNTVNIRMVTGDHLQTALKVAVEAGIIEPGQLEDTSVHMEGKDFRARIGKY